MAGMVLVTRPANPGAGMDEYSVALGGLTAELQQAIGSPLAGVSRSRTAMAAAPCLDRVRTARRCRGRPGTR